MAVFTGGWRGCSSRTRRDPARESVKGRDLALVAIINLAWAGNVLAVKYAVTAVPPVTAAALRYTIVLLIALPWLRVVRGRMPGLLGAALAQGALWIAFLNLSFAHASSIAALSLVGQLGVPISLGLAVLLLGERVRLTRSLAVAGALLGVAVIGFDPAIANQGWPIALSIAAAFSYAIGAILLRGMGGVHPFTIFAWIGLTAAPMLIAGSLLFEPGAIAALPHASARGLTAIGYSALFSSLIGHAGATYLYGRYPVSTIAPLFIPSPVIGAALAVIVLGNPVTPRLIIGGAIVMIAVAVITLRTNRSAQAAA